tara:strand:+ start:1820 stop:2470 length:651 start_codon:yes stop_codon:yes gene_type:complete
MKIKKSQLKQLIKEEILEVINEMSIDEMAFSIDDLETARADVEATDTGAQAMATGEKLHRLLRNFQAHVNNAGGSAAVDASEASILARNQFQPYHKDLAIIYKVLEKLSNRMFDKSESGHRWDEINWALKPASVVRRVFDTQSNRTNPLHARAQAEEQLKRAFEYLDSIIELARETAEQPAVGFDEPYLSAENANQLEQLAARAKSELTWHGHSRG